jgi:hypothetical protein
MWRTVGNLAGIERSFFFLDAAIACSISEKQPECLGAQEVLDRVPRNCYLGRTRTD